MTNQDPEDLLEVLNQATAPGETIDPSLDGPTAELRETWLALGRLLEASQPAEAPAVACPQSPRARRWQPAVAVLLAVAAAIVVAVSLARSTVETKRPVEVAKSPAAPTAAPIQAPSTFATTRPAASPASAVSLAWDDALDEHISQVGRRLRGIEGDWSFYGQDYAHVQEAVEQFAQEMQGDPL